MAHAIYIDPILSLQGSLGKGNRFYTRVLNGKNVIQSRPDRSRHTKTPAEAANQQRFAQTYGTSAPRKNTTHPMKKING